MLKNLLLFLYQPRVNLQGGFVFNIKETHPSEFSNHLRASRQISKDTVLVHIPSSSSWGANPLCGFKIESGHPYDRTAENVTCPECLKLIRHIRAWEASCGNGVL